MAQSKSRKLVTGTISAAVIASALAPVAASASTAKVTTVYNPSTKTVYQGQKVSLPSTVTVKYSNGKKASAKVSWGKVSTSVGTHKITGHVAGTTKMATITVVVKADSVKTVSYSNVVNVKAGLVPTSLKAMVTYYSGRTTTATINLSNVNTSKVGSQMVKTTVAGKTVTVTVNVKAPSVKSATALNGKQISVVFETGKTETIDLPYTFKDGSPTTSFWYYGYNYKAITLTTPYVAPVTVSGVSAINGTTSGNLSLAAGNNTVTLQANDANGKAITSGITWSSSDDSVAHVTSTGKVIAENSGSVTITATDAQGNKATYKVTVAGQAAGIQLSAGSTSITANGMSTDTVTASVVDANGNTVSNFNGTVNVAITNNGAAYLTADGKTKANSTGLTLSNVNVVNGVATFQVLAGTTAGLTDTVSLSGLTASSGSAVSTNVNYPTISLSSVAPVASKLAVTSSLTGVSVNGATSNNVFDVTAQVQDSTGNNYGASEYVTLQITGPGSFSSTSDVKSLTVYTGGNGASAPIPVYASQGTPGNITVTATSNGLSSGSVTVPAFVSAAPASVQISSSKETTSDGTNFTLYTAQLMDANGNVVTTGTNASDPITITDNTSTSSVGGTLVYHGVDSNNQPSGSAPIQFTNGVAKFAVENTSVGTANPTITVNDTTLNFSQTAGYTDVVGAPVQVAFSSTTNQSVKAGQSETFTAQLEDASGNAVKTAGQNVDFYFNSNTVGATLPNGSSLTGINNAYVVSTDANGVASVTVNVPSGASAGNSFELYANLQNGSFDAAQGPTDTVTSASSYVTSMQFGNFMGTGGSFSAYAGFPANNQVVTNNAISGVTVALENAIGDNSLADDQIQVTTSNPSVLALDSYDANSTTSKTVTASTGVAALPTITPTQAGTATITVKDLTNPAVPALTETLTVEPGMVQANGEVTLNGAAISSSNPLTVSANTPVAVTLYNVDAGGNPVPVTSMEANNGTAAQFALSDPNGGEFRLTQNGAAVNNVSIPVGQDSVTLYYVNSTAGSYTSTPVAATPLSATAAVLANTTTPVVGTPDNFTISLTGGSTFNGTLPITWTGATASANGTAATLPSTATFVNGVATVAVTLTNPSTQHLQVSVDGLQSASDDVTPTASN